RRGRAAPEPGRRCCRRRPDRDERDENGESDPPAGREAWLRERDLPEQMLLTHAEAIVREVAKRQRREVVAHRSNACFLVAFTLSSCPEEAWSSRMRRRARASRERTVPIGIPSAAAASP